MIDSEDYLFVKSSHIYWYSYFGLGQQELKENDVYALWQSVKEAEELGADPLGELAATLKVQIAEKKVEFESIQI